MREKLMVFLVGCVIGGVVAGVVVSRVRGDGPQVRGEHRSEITQLEQDNQKLASEKTELVHRVRDLERTRAQAEAKLEQTRRELEMARGEEDPAEVVPTGPPTEEEIEATIKDFGQNLQALWTSKSEAAVAARDRMVALMRRGGKELIQRLIDEFRDTSNDIGERVTLAHALAQSDDPVALEVLTSLLRDPEATIFDQRFAAHALAFSDAEGLDPVLSHAARTMADGGARANAAFGLARRGSDEGVELYIQLTDEAFERSDSLAVGYLSGFPLIGERAYPAVRERLLKYKDTQAVLVLIEFVKGSGDRGALENLRKLANDPSRPPSIQKAAQGAIEVLEGEAE